MCGIFGFAGIPGKKTDLRKIKTLGVYNIQRGVDNCGYYYSGNVAKGVKDEANWQNFIDKNQIVRGDLKGEIFLGHTRKTTCGGNTIESAHPHTVGNYVQTHNGSLKNHWELCTKHDVDHKNITVDSIALAHIIQKDGFGVLKEYTGAAALAFTFMDDSNTMYLYHGASKDAVNSKLWEERPLHYLLQPEGIYYSSIPESLNFISSNKERARILPHNIVYKITDGAFVDAFQYVVDREDVNIPKYYYGNAYNQYDACSTGAKSAVGEGNIAGLHILKENLPTERTKQDLFYRFGRFFNSQSMNLMHGIYDISRDGFIMTPLIKTEEVVTRYYFVRGIMMKSKKEYDTVIKDLQNWLQDKDCIFARSMSKYTRYPVISLPGEGKRLDASANFWYMDLKLFKGSFKTCFNTRTYDINLGQLKAIKQLESEKNLSPVYEFLTGIILFTVDNRGYLNEEAMPQLSEYKIINVNTTKKAPEETKVINLEPKLKSPIVRLVALVRGCFDKQIKDVETVMALPECFIMFIDFYNRHYYGDDIAKSALQDSTIGVLEELIAFNKTFREYCNEFDDGDMLAIAKIRECFAPFNEEEILTSANRFTYIDFKTNTYKVPPKAEGTKQLQLPFNKEDQLTPKAIQTANFVGLLKKAKEQFAALKKLADDMQALDEVDDAQDIAFEIYRFSDPIEIEIKDAFTDLDMPF